MKRAEPHRVVAPEPFAISHHRARAIRAHLDNGSTGTAGINMRRAVARSANEVDNIVRGADGSHVPAAENNPRQIQPKLNQHHVRTVATNISEHFAFSGNRAALEILDNLAVNAVVRVAKQ